MVAFGHTAVGAGVGVLTYSVIGTTISPPVGILASFLIGIISHYLFDAIPHGHFFHENKFKELILKDIILDLGLPAFIFLLISYLKFGLSPQTFFILLGIAGSQLPDIISGFVFLNVLKPTGLLAKERNFHINKIHWHGTGKDALIWGKRDIWQVATLLISLSLLVFWS